MRKLLILLLLFAAPLAARTKRHKVKLDKPALQAPPQVVACDKHNRCSVSNSVLPYIPDQSHATASTTVRIIGIQW